MLDAFYSGVTSCVDPDCRKALKVGAHSSLFCSMAQLRPVHIQEWSGAYCGARLWHLHWSACAGMGKRPVMGTSTSCPWQGVGL